MRKVRLSYRKVKAGDRVVRVRRDFEKDPSGSVIAWRGEVKGTVRRVVPVKRHGGGVPAAWVYVVWDNWPDRTGRIEIQHLEVVRESGKGGGTMARLRQYKDFERSLYQDSWKRNAKCLRDLGLTKRSFSGLRSDRDSFLIEVRVRGERKSWYIEAGSIWDAKAAAVEKLCGE